MQDHLAACPSSAHRAVLGLVPVAFGRAAADGLHEDLSASDPQDLVEIATYQFVHTLLGSAFENKPSLRRSVPEDLVLYFAEIQAANARRNSAIQEQLSALGQVVSEAGVVAVALKGAAELLDPVQPIPATRFLSDIDVLLPEGDIAALRTSLEERGATEDPVHEINSRHHHHYPPIHLPGWPAPIELHRRLGPDRFDGVLPPETVLLAAHPAGSTGLHVPSRICRMVHAVAHSQLADAKGAMADRIALRDTIDFVLLAQAASPEEIEASRSRFSDAGLGDRFDLFHAVARRLVYAEQTTMSAQVDRALALFGAPEAARRGSDLRWLKHYLSGFLRDPERRHHYISMLCSWRDLRRIRAFHQQRRRRIR